jgi:hypothetical protein
VLAWSRVVRGGPLPLRAAALVFLAGCASRAGAAAGVPDASQPDAFDDDAPNAFGSSACAACQEQSCAPQVAQCTDDPGCANYLACVLACNVGADGNVDPLCVAGCPATGGTSTRQAIGSVSACFGTGAGSLCASCGGDGGMGYSVIHEGCMQVTSTTQPCIALEQSECCNTFSACESNPACVAIGNCASGCPSSDILPDAGADGGFPSCKEACMALHPEARAIYVRLDVCFNFECYTQAACGGAPDPCVACLAARCTQAVLDEETTPGGYGLYDCIAGCGPNEKCESACEAQYPGAVRAVLGSLACQENYCANVCLGSGGV